MLIDCLNLIATPTKHFSSEIYFFFAIKQNDLIVYTFFLNMEQTLKHVSDNPKTKKSQFKVIDCRGWFFKNRMAYQ